MNLLETAPWISVLSTTWIALLLTLIGLALYQTSRSPKVSNGDAVLVDLCLGLVTVAAAMFWFTAALQLVF